MQQRDGSINGDDRIEGESKCCNFLSDTATGVPATFIEVGEASVLEHYCGKPNGIHLSGFKDKPFKQNQQWRADRQCSSCAMQSVLAIFGTEMKS